MNRFLTRLAVVGPLVLGGVMGVAPVAHASTEQTFENFATDGCLFSSAEFVKIVQTIDAVPDRGCRDLRSVWVITKYGSSRRLQNKRTGYCLDSNASGNAYMNRCSTIGTNRYQLWTVLPGKWSFTLLLKDVATGRCLDSNMSHRVYTNPCGTGNEHQNWS